MRYFVLAAAAAFVAAAPAAAQDSGTNFGGVRAGVNVGLADDDIFGTEAFTYGAEVGYDLNVGGGVIGASAELQDSDDTGREIALIARAGVQASPNFLVYALGGYTNIKPFDGLKLDGYRIGAGVEMGFAKNGFAKIEQRYSNYELGAEGYQTVLGVGVRF